MKERQEKKRLIEAKKIKGRREREENRQRKPNQVKGKSRVKRLSFLRWSFYIAFVGKNLKQLFPTLYKLIND